VDTRIWARGVAIVALATTLATASGCSDPKPAQRPAPSNDSPSASPSIDPAEEQARAEVLAAYNGYLEAYIKASATADYRTTELAQFVAEPLLGQLINNLFNMSRSGVHNEGRPIWQPRVTELRLDANEAVIQDCFDSTNWNAVGGKGAPSAQAKKYPVVVKAKRVSGKWYVYDSTAQRSSTC
jgi:hypothetical protein